MVLLKRALSTARGAHAAYGRGSCAASCAPQSAHVALHRNSRQIAIRYRFVVVVVEKSAALTDCILESCLGRRVPRIIISCEDEKLRVNPPCREPPVQNYVQNAGNGINKKHVRRSDKMTAQAGASGRLRPAVTLSQAKPSPLASTASTAALLPPPCVLNSEC